MTFLNLGYLADPGELGFEEVPGIADRVSERLYDEVVDGTVLAGRTVVEVGCGSGAGSAYLARTHLPESLLGVDFNKDMIVWCREHHAAANLRFLQGDALSLPIDSDSIDALVNVESSHCYPSRLRFFEEVARILCPGGSFFFADIVTAGEDGSGPAVVDAQLKKAGLIIGDCVDITKNVLAARDAVSRSNQFRTAMRERMPRWMVPLVEESLHLTGTRPYAGLVSGHVRYMRWVASKPSDDHAIAGTAAAVVS